MLSFEVLEKDGIPAARAATECDEFSVEATAADTIIDTAASGVFWFHFLLVSLFLVSFFWFHFSGSFFWYLQLFHQCDYQTYSEAMQTVDLSRLRFSDRHLEKQLAHFDD